MGTADGPSLTTGILRRAGLSILSDNDEFEHQNRQDIKAAENALRDLRRGAQELTAKCFGQLEVFAAEVRAEQEKRLLSERVDHELEKFREQQRQREEMEDERLRLLYRSMVCPAKSMQERPAARFEITQQSCNGFPPIIYSAVQLQRSPNDGMAEIIAPRDRTRSSVDSFPRCRNVGRKFNDTCSSTNSSASSALDGIRWLGDGFVEPTVSSRPAFRERLSTGQFERQRTSRLKHGRGATDEAHDLLKVNLARLSRLEMLGL